MAGIDKPIGVAYDYLNKKIIWTDANLGRSVIEQAEIMGHGCWEKGAAASNWPGPT